MSRRVPTRPILAVACAVVAVGATWQPPVEDEPTPEAIAFFETHIRPALAEHCHSCHGAEGKPKGGLRLTDRASLLNGGITDAGVVPGDADASLLIEALRWDDPFLQMPPDAKLPDATIQRFEEWVAMGAPWPETGASRPTTDEDNSIVPDFDLLRRRDEHWCWQPITDPDVPPLAGWGTGPIDAFVHEGLRELGLHPAAPATRRAFVRRVTYDLAGLPPTPEAVAAYVADDRPEAKAELVDRLLASPAFGEHWATFWLDRARYAESLGHEFDFTVHGAWHYRDYLVRALNADVPYDRIVAEHVAGDLLPPRIDPATGLDEAPLGTIFWWLGEQTHSPVDVLLHTADKVDNQIDVFSKAFQGVTTACARCHDHMFDAISQRDYFSMQSILRSSRYGWTDVSGVEDDEAWSALVTAKQAVLEHDAVRERLAALAVPEPAAVRDGEDLAMPRPGDAAGWSSAGAPLAHLTGDVVLGTDPPTPVLRRNVPGTIDSATLGTRVQAHVRSPEQPVARRYVHVLAAGHLAKLRVVVDGFELIQDPLHGHLRRDLKEGELAWRTFDLETYRTTPTDPHRWSLEAIDSPNPDHSGGRNDDPDAWFRVVRVVTSDVRETPAVEEPLAVEALEGDGVPAELWERWTAAVEATPRPVWRPALLEGTPHRVDVHLRGSVHRFGESAPRQNLSAVVGIDHGDASGSGRLHLVATTNTLANPLTARVAVNRLWHHLFGRGIVATPDNLGVLGEPPSHPELLDHLATRFVAGGWSQKALIRAIVLTDTYAQSVVPDPRTAARALEVDPLNAHLHRRSLRRLTAEQLRDALLSVSGRLDPALGGAPVPMHLTEFMQGRGRPGSSGPRDGAGRRTLYVAVRRNFLSPFLSAFDRPAPFSCVGRRNETNVPAQALILLNDPLVLELADALGERVRAEADTDDARLTRMFELALGRAPRDDERARLTPWLSEPDGWARAAHLVLNLKAFRWVE